VEATDLCTLASTLQEHTDKKSKEETLGLVQYILHGVNGLSMTNLWGMECAVLENIHMSNGCLLILIPSGISSYQVWIFQ